MATTLISSGDSSLDKLRQEYTSSPTNKENFKERALFFKTWTCTVQQLAYTVEELLPVSAALNPVESNIVYNPDGADQDSRTGSEELYKAIDSGLQILEEKLKSGGFQFQVNPSESSPRKIDKMKDPYTGEWPSYQGDCHHSGCADAEGGYNPKEAWRFPIGLGWRSIPFIEGDIIYAASPGIRYRLFCLDKTTGDVLWKSRRDQEIVTDQHYRSPCSASDVIDAGDNLLLREMGSRGSIGIAKHIEKLSKTDGTLLEKWDAKHIDYRAGYTSLTANSHYAVYLTGRHDIEQVPPIAGLCDTIECIDIESGKKLWMFKTGAISADPLLLEDRVIAGCCDGSLFCLNLEGDAPHHKRDRILWQINLPGALNTKASADEKNLYIPCSNGTLYALDKTSGEILWKHKLMQIRKKTRRPFTPVLMDGEQIVLGSVQGELFCLGKKDGTLHWQIPVSGELRTKPFILEGDIHVLNYEGTLFKIEDNLEKSTAGLVKHLDIHPVLADPLVEDERIYLNDSDLMLHCVNKDGTKQWSRSVIDCVWVEDVRVLTDQIAGGAYYQSKPTAADHKVFIGAPSGYMHALDEATGREIWRFDCGSAISAGPLHYKNRLYFGQQGGDDLFYCLDPQNGEVLWTQTLGWVWGSATAAQNRIFVPGIDGYVNCLDSENGNLIWRRRTMRSTCTEPVVDGNTVFFGGWDHYLYAFNLHNGELNWKYHVGGGCDSGTAIAKDGRVFLPTGGTNRFRCLDGKTGKVLWEFHRPGTEFNATPAYDGQNVFISVARGKGLGGVCIRPSICCLDAESGALVWEKPGGGLTAAICDRNTVYAGSTASPLIWARDKTNGSLLWEYLIDNKMEESVPSLAYGKIIVLGSDGFIRAIE